MQPHHGEIKTLSTTEIMKLLEKSRYAHLACHNKDEVYLVPITMAFQDGYIYSHSGAGHKIDLMRQNPNVCVQAEEVSDFFHWKSVIAWGKFEELKGDEALQGMRWLIRKVVDKEPTQKKSDLELDMSALLETQIIYRIKIDKATGRYEN